MAYTKERPRAPPLQISPQRRQAVPLLCLLGRSRATVRCARRTASRRPAADVDRANCTVEPPAKTAPTTGVLLRRLPLPPPTWGRALPMAGSADGLQHDACQCALERVGVAPPLAPRAAQGPRPWIWGGLTPVRRLAAGVSALSGFWTTRARQVLGSRSFAVARSPLVPVRRRGSRSPPRPGAVSTIQAPSA
jgi:hypothetical protein